MLHDSNHNVGKGPFVYKQTYLAKRCGLFGLITSTIRSYDQAVYDWSQA